MNWKPVVLTFLAFANVAAMGGLAVCVSVLRVERDDAIVQRDAARKQNSEARAYVAEMEKHMITLPALSSGTLTIDKNGKPRIELDQDDDRWVIGPNGLPKLETVVKKPKEDRVQ